MNLDTKDVQVGSIVRKEENSDAAYKVEKIENDIVTLKDKDGNDLVNAWFVCFAPYEKPEVAVVVMIENGGHGNYAAEVARDVLTQYFGMNESTEINESMTATPFVEQIR